MEIDPRFPTKLETVFDAPEPFRTSMIDNIPSGESIRLLVHAPAFSAVNKNSPATVLAVTGNRWLVFSENEDGGVSVEKSSFDETLFLELSSVLISGQLTIHFATVGTAYSATIYFDTVEAGYYRQAVELILNGIDQVYPAASPKDHDEALISEACPMNIRADVIRYRPKGQPLLTAVQWPAVVAGFQRELCPAGAILITKRELVLISEGKTFSLYSGAIITYFPLVRLADFHVGHHDRSGVLALQVHAAHGGEKQETIFPSDYEQAVSEAMEYVLVAANREG